MRDRPDDEGDDPQGRAVAAGSRGGRVPEGSSERDEREDDPLSHSRSIFGDEARSGTIDGRAHAAWRSWLGALASDPKAAMAAALAYESLTAEARDAWLEALDIDAPDVHVPKVALYAPLLAVEGDESRRARIERALAQDNGGAGGAHAGGFTAPVAMHALRGIAPNGDHVCVVVSPLYLDFVELLVCRYGADGIASARHEPLSHVRDKDAIPEAAEASLELTAVATVVEDLAHAVVADRRAGREPPEALQRFIHLFAPFSGGACDDVGPCDPARAPGEDE